MFSEKNKVVFDTMGGVKLADEMPSYSLFKDRSKLIGNTVNVKGYLITKPKKYGPSVLLYIEPIDGVELLYLPERYVAEFTGFTLEEKKAIVEGHLALVNFREVEGENGLYCAFDYADR